MDILVRARLAVVALLLMGIWLGFAAGPASAKPPKLSATIGAAGDEVDATGTLGKGGPSKPPRKKWKVLLEERVNGKWATRTSGRLAGAKLRSFALEWIAPKPGSIDLRVRVKAGRKTVVASPASKLVLDGGYEPTVDVVDAGAVAKLPTDSDPTLILNGTRNFAPGQFISTAPGSGAPSGFLLKVVATSVSDGQTTVKTEPASLYQAVPNGSIDMSLGDLGSATPLNAAARRFSRAMRAPGSPQNVPFNKKVNCSGTASMDLEGAIEADLGPSFQLNWSKTFGVPTGIESAQATIDAALSAQAKASVSGSASCTLTPITLVNPRWVVVAVVAGVPVPITIDVPIKLRANGTVSGAVAVDASASVDGSVGVRYQDGDVSGIRELNRSADANFNVGANAQLDARIGPDIEIAAGWRIPALGGLAAKGNLDVTTGMVLKYSTSQTPPGDLCIPFTAIAGFGFEIPVIDDINTGDIKLFDTSIRCWRFPAQGLDVSSTGPDGAGGIGLRLTGENPFAEDYAGADIIVFSDGQSCPEAGHYPDHPHYPGRQVAFEDLSDNPPGPFEFTTTWYDAPPGTYTLCGLLHELDASDDYYTGIAFDEETLVVP